MTHTEAMTPREIANQLGYLAGRLYVMLDPEGADPAVDPHFIADLEGLLYITGSEARHPETLALVDNIRSLLAAARENPEAKL